MGNAEPKERWKLNIRDVKRKNGRTEKQRTSKRIRHIKGLRIDWSPDLALENSRVFLVRIDTQRDLDRDEIVSIVGPLLDATSFTRDDLGLHNMHPIFCF